MSEFLEPTSRGFGPRQIIPDFDRSSELLVGSIRPSPRHFKKFRCACTDLILGKPWGFVLNPHRAVGSKTSICQVTPLGKGFSVAARRTRGGGAGVVLVEGGKNQAPQIRADCGRRDRFEFHPARANERPVGRDHGRISAPRSNTFRSATRARTTGHLIRLSRWQSRLANAGSPSRLSAPIRIARDGRAR